MCIGWEKEREKMDGRQEEGGREGDRREKGGKGKDRRKEKRKEEAKRGRRKKVREEDRKLDPYRGLAASGQINKWYTPRTLLWSVLAMV